VSTNCARHAKQRDRPIGVFIRFDEVEEINLEIMIPLGVLSL
jgi:hypothetical protein